MMQTFFSASSNPMMDVRRTIDDAVHSQTVQDVWQTIQHRPRLSGLLVLIVSTLVLTRIITTVQFHLHRSRTAKAVHPIQPPVYPYSIPWLANGPQYLKLPIALAAIAKAYPKLSVWTFKVANTKHHVVLAPSMVHQMAVSKTIIPKFTMRPFIHRTLQCFWNDGGLIEMHFDPVRLDKAHSVLSNMMHSSFLNPNVDELIKGVSTTELCTFSQSPVDQLPWERVAAMSAISPEAASASFYTLIRHYAAQLTTNIFFSPDLLVNYPTILEDLFYADTRFEIFLAGGPQYYWPSNRGPALARDRVVEAIRQQSIAYHKVTKGQDPGAMWSRVDETCEIMAGRIKECADDGDFDESLPERRRGTKAAILNAPILWALQINAPSVVFWMLFHIYSNPNLLADIRAEISPYIKTAASDFTSGGISEKPRLEINNAGLRGNAKLLMGAFHETMRMEVISMTYKKITDDFTATESAQDAAIYGHGDNPLTYEFKRGDFVLTPHVVHHFDERYFANPHTFDARRFWVNSAASKGASFGQEKSASSATDSKDVEVSYLTTHPWGGGAQLCKGKKFAESEVVLVAAAIIHQWEFTPAKRGLMGEFSKVTGDDALKKAWKHPGRLRTAGTVRPETDPTVIVERRKTN
jgi:hypothetical protein